MWDVPIIALTTDFLRVRRHPTAMFPSWNASDTPPLERSDRLWNPLRADHLLRQAISLLALLASLLSRSPDQVHDIFRNRSQLRTVFRDHGALRIFLRAPARTKLADGYRLCALLKRIPDELHTGGVQHCQRLLYSPPARARRLETTPSDEEKDRRMCHIRDRVPVGPPSLGVR